MSRFSRIVDLLEETREQIIENLRESGGDEGYLRQKQQLDDALRCLWFCAEHNINPTARVVHLPFQNRGIFEYHIMADDETDDITNWAELEDDNGDRITAIVGDLLVLNSEAKWRQQAPPDKSETWDEGLST